jgi:hypothetical protein
MMPRPSPRATWTSQRLALADFTYGEGDAEAEPPAEALAEEELVEGALAEEKLADDPLAEEAPVGPALMVMTTGALGRVSVPAEGSVLVTVPYSSGPCTDLMAATV